MTSSDAAAQAGRKRRERWPENFPRPSNGEVPYAQCRVELDGYSAAELTRIILDDESWREVMLPILRAVDAERRCARAHGPDPRYLTEELEAVLLFKMVSGLETVKDAVERLAGNPQARALLGFDRARNQDRPANMGRRRVKNGARRCLVDGVPSESTLSRHSEDFGEERRLAAYKAFHKHAKERHLATPELHAASRLLFLDGTEITVRYTCPIIDPKTRKVVNKKRVTCPDGGYVPADGDRGGHGFKLLIICAEDASELDYSLIKIHDAEVTTAIELVTSSFGPEILPQLGDPILRVTSADGNFTSPHLRAALRQYGIIENIHTVSHRHEQSSLENAAKNNKFEIKIDGYDNWLSNGHRELRCVCGSGTISRRVDLDSKGCVRSSVEGRCRTCGSITITSGQWRRAQNPSRFVRVDPSNPFEERDYLFGNSLTFNDPLAGVYGKLRFGREEGMHGHMTTRFGLLLPDRPFQSKAEAETAVAGVFAITHVLALVQRVRARDRRAEDTELAVAA